MIFVKNIQQCVQCLGRGLVKGSGGSGRGGGSDGGSGHSGGSGPSGGSGGGSGNCRVGIEMQRLQRVVNFFSHLLIKTFQIQNVFPRSDDLGRVDVEVVVFVAVGRL